MQTKSYVGLLLLSAQQACYRKGLQQDPSNVELHEIAEAAEFLLKRTAEEKYGNLSSSC
jgi:hypothetical protein